MAIAKPPQDKQTTVHFRLSPDEHRRLLALAKMERRSINQLMQLLLVAEFTRRRVA